MSESTAIPTGWPDLLGSTRTARLLVVLGGTLLYATNTLLATTIAPSAIHEFGGIALITWLTAAYLASSIASAAAGGLLSVIGGVSANVGFWRLGFVTVALAAAALAHVAARVFERDVPVPEAQPPPFPFGQLILDVSLHRFHLHRAGV